MSTSTNELQPNGYLKHQAILVNADHTTPNGVSHDNRITPDDMSHDSQVTSPNNNTTTTTTYTGSSGSEIAVYDEAMQDPFYNFSEGGIGSAGMLEAMDPLNPNSIPYDDCFEPENDQTFDPELFDSILSTGRDILSRYESTSSIGSGGGRESAVSFELPVEGLEAAKEVEEGRGSEGGSEGEEVTATTRTEMTAEGERQSEEVVEAEERPETGVLLLLEY